MSRKALLVLAVGLVLGGRASFAGVFADVPFDHWAYQAVEELAQAGCLEGYPDGTFRGPQPMTRYEFAVAVARCYQKIQKMIPPTLKGDKGDKGDSGAPGAAGATGATGATGAAGRDGRDGAPGPQGERGAKGDKGDPGVVPQDWLRRLEALEKLVKEFQGELKQIGAQTEAMLARLTALESKVAAVSDTVEAQGRDIEALKKFQWFANVSAELGADGSQDISGVNDGDLGLEPGEAYSMLSLQAGVNANLGGDMRGRFSWWYDSDGNQHHGKVGGGPRGNVGLAAIGLDEAWVRMPALGGRWIFGRQYAGQDYATGEAKASLGMGTGYYTGAALNAIRAEYDVGTHVMLTFLAQAEDNASNIVGLGGNIAGVARADIEIPWWKVEEGRPLFRVGVQTVGHAPSNSPSNALGTINAFNDAARNGEFSVSGDLMVDVLKGFRVEYTKQFKAANGADPKTNTWFGGGADGSNDAQSLYATLGILDTPTFKLDVAGGVADEDYQISDSVLSNPYVQAASGAFSLFDRPVIVDARGGASGLMTGPTQGYDVHFQWMIGKRPLKIRWAGSTRKLDAFNWMVYGEFPVVMTSNGNVSIGGGFIDVDPVGTQAPGLGHGLGADTAAVRVKAGITF